MTHYHLSPSAQGWALTRDPEETTISAWRNRWEAIDKCKMQLEGESCLLAIHGRDGNVEKVCRFTDSDDEPHDHAFDPDESGSDLEDDKAA